MQRTQVVKKARDIMQSLEGQIHETIGLGILLPDSAECLVLAEVEGTSGFAFHIKVDYHVPLHTSAPGKALLAFLPEEQRDDLISRMHFKRFTDQTITSPDAFKAELREVAEKGYSIDISEQLEGCQCVGVPVVDSSGHAVAAFWTTGPSSQLPVSSFEQVAGILKKGAQELSLRLYGTSRPPADEVICSVVDQACEIMQNNLHQPVDVRQLAGTFYVSYSWFRKAFKDRTGQSPSAYHLRLRLDHAKHLLKETDLSVRRISERLGFKTQNHFSALFKRKTGLSPSAFRGQ